MSFDESIPQDNVAEALSPEINNQQEFDEDSANEDNPDPVNQLQAPKIANRGDTGISACQSLFLGWSQTQQMSQAGPH